MQMSDAGGMSHMMPNSTVMAGSADMHEMHEMHEMPAGEMASHQMASQASHQMADQSSHQMQHQMPNTTAPDSAPDSQQQNSDNNLNCCYKCCTPASAGLVLTVASTVEVEYRALDTTLPLVDDTPQPVFTGFQRPYLRAPPRA